MKNLDRAKKSKNKKAVAGQVRSGDVLLSPVVAIPLGAKMIADHEGYILALGETTGHSHTIEKQVKVWSIGEQRYVEVTEETTISHEEHKVVPLKPGLYEVIPEERLNLEGQWERATD